MNRHLLCLFLPMMFFPKAVFCEPVISSYEFHNYVRHPRLEEKDKRQGRSFTFRPGLEVITDVDDVSISLFDEKMGRTPWEKDDLAPGRYRLNLEKRGYTTMEFWVAVPEGRRIVIEANVNEDRGLLLLRNLPPEGLVEIDRRSVTGDRLDLPAGRRMVTVKAFGWQTLTQSVTIPAGGRVVWTYEGTPMPFSLSDFRVRPAGTSPNEARNMLLIWHANAPGTAVLRVLDSKDLELDSRPLSINESEGRYLWDASVKGRPLDKGTYTLLLDGVGINDIRDSVKAVVRLDDHYTMQPRLETGPVPGLLHAPGAAMLPASSWQLSTGAGIQSFPEKRIVMVPAWVTFRISPAYKWEVGGHFVVNTRDRPDAVSLSAALYGAWRWLSDPFKANLALSFSWQGFITDAGKSPDYDAFGNLPGLGLFLPIEFPLNRWSLMFTPGTVVSFLSGEDRRLSLPARISGTLALGVLFESSVGDFGLSGTVRTPMAPAGVEDEWELRTGFEYRLALPGNRTHLTVLVALRVLPEPLALLTALNFELLY